MLTENQLLEVFDIIAKEIGVTKDEIYETDDFSDLGLDDVLSRSIIGQIKEQINLDLPPNVFRTNRSATEVRNYLGEHHEIRNQDARGGSSIQVRSIETNHQTLDHHPARPIKPRAPLSIVLQGRPSTAQKTIFLLPDGSGSAMVYSQFPQISKSVCIVAFNSPFLINYNGNSISFNTSIENLCLIWVEEIRRRQPRGPYILGGYSAGGYYAFEVAKQLRREGEKVEKLVLIDSPCRVEYGAPQTEAIRFLSDHGMLGDWGAEKKTPDWFVRHFQGTIDAVERYTPKFMGGEGEANATEMPECFVIWATKGILEEADIKFSETGLDMSAKITKFMLGGKKEADFGLHGWDRILPGAMIWETRVPGNHFTLVHRPNVGLTCSVFEVSRLGSLTLYSV